MKEAKKRQKLKSSSEDSSWQFLMEQLKGEPCDDYPLVSVVIPTFNCAHTIAVTLDSIQFQNYEELQVIVIDAASTDRTVEIVKDYGELVDRVYSVSDWHIYEMINRGISLCHGRYLNFLYPGDFYVAVDMVKSMMRLVVEHEYPDLAYGACILRNEEVDPRLLLRPLNLRVVSKGGQPTSLQSSFFRIDSIKKIGKFLPGYEIRGGHDLFCRYAKHPRIRTVVINRVLVDSHRNLGAASMIHKSLETFRVLRKNFGILTALKWWLVQNHFRFVKWGLQTLKSMFLGKR